MGCTCIIKTTYLSHTYSMHFGSELYPCTTNSLSLSHTHTHTHTHSNTGGVTILILYWKLIEAGQVVLPASCILSSFAYLSGAWQKKTKTSKSKVKSNWFGDDLENHDNLTSHTTSWCIFYTLNSSCSCLFCCIDGPSLVHYTAQISIFCFLFF